MRIGIVTFHCAYNYGSVLQAWALTRTLENMGHSVAVIDYRGADFSQYHLIQGQSLKSLVSSVLFFAKNWRRSDSFETFISESLPLTKRYGEATEGRLVELTNSFDCFVCGSDQIWNLDCTHGPVGPYFLNFAGDSRRVAYAPSIANSSFGEDVFGPMQKRRVTEWLSRFSAISVREESTASLFQPLAPVKIETCVDPTLLLNPREYEHVVCPVAPADGSLFVYMLERNDSLIAYAGGLAREMGVSVSYVSKRPLDFGVPAKNFYGSGPAEFLGIISGCCAVVTNSFHATVFSLLFGKPFETFATTRSGSRMTELLTNLNMRDKLVDGREIVLPARVPWDELSSLLDGLRADSLGFLSRALAD